MSKKQPTTNINSLEFQKLQDRWYRKLKKSGFVDLELAKNRKGLLIPGQDEVKYHDRREVLMPEFVQDNPGTLGNQIIFNYYRLCRIFLENGRFRSKIHKKTFKLYTNGQNYREISKILKRQRRKHLASSTWYVAKLMADNKQDLLTFHLTHPEGEFLHRTDVPSILDPSYSPHLKTRRGKSKY